jgi:AraC family ethanolamine operon transcriptional activator
MQIPQPLPIRTVRLESQDPDALAAAQPERQRRYRQITRGRFQGSMSERAFGRAALLRESWSCGLRVRCDRPGGYTVFAVPTIAGEVRWCGVALEPGAVLRIEEPWELSTTAPFEFVAFAIDRAALAAAEAALAGGERPKPPQGNAVVYGAGAGRLAERLRGLLRDIGHAADPAALSAAASDLLDLAAKLYAASRWQAVERPPPRSLRRAAVARIEEYLHALRGEPPSIPVLCAFAGVSERTLQYAFREHLGMTPVRYLKLLRLDRVHRELRDPRSDLASVTEAAVRSGFYDLGRFAGDYRSLFGELPSETLGRALARRHGDPVRVRRIAKVSGRDATFERRTSG